MYQSPELCSHGHDARVTGSIAAESSVARRFWVGADRLSLPVVFIASDSVAELDEPKAVLRRAGWQVESLPSEGMQPAANDAVPSCLVLDLSLTGRGEGRLLQLAAGRADMPVICITAPGDVRTTVRAMKAGAVDVLSLPVETDALLPAIRDALDLCTATLQQGLAARQLQHRYASLSLRERQVMALVVSGLLNKQVGGELGISEITVKAHRGRVMRKMQASSLAGLVKMAASLELAS